MIYLILFFFMGQTLNSSEFVCETHKIIEVVAFTLPDIITTIGAIDTEERFDNFSHRMDTTQLKADQFKIELGEKINDYSFLDIRTKVIVTYRNGNQKKYFLDSFGHIMYNSIIYQGSYKQLLYLRQE